MSAMPSSTLSTIDATSAPNGEGQPHSPHANGDHNKPATATFDEKLATSLEVIREAFRRYAPSDELFVSFNGGKDCTVLLHMVDTVFRETMIAATTIAPNPDQQPPPQQLLLCLYLQSERPFDEIERFVNASTEHYPIRLERAPAGQSKQQALHALCAAHPKLRACLMGCRRSDPWCERLGTFEATTAGWPPLMRVNPLLEWTCADIWDYIEQFEVPYCSLYDVGYTSLGDQNNTVPNPHLRYVDSETGLVAYKPAHTLRHADELERVGRTSAAASNAKS